ncbi:sulfurtransferase [Streptomyces sp. NPDC086783]|uniref:sulfurtransferase n=1 Tax=Streptomyces sp. NPDC086783 TaxID=3365758 RepID=UPI0037FA0CA2
MNLLPLSPLVSEHWLAAHLDDPNLVVLDATALLPTPRHDADYRCFSGYNDWVREHIPGSRHADLTVAFSDQASPYHFTAPSPNDLAQRLSNFGVANGDAVVIYDRTGGNWAARLWWMLHTISVPAAVLDGGLKSWRTAGNVLACGEAVAPTPAAVPIVPVPIPNSWATVADVAAISQGDMPGTLVCALPTAGYEGTTPSRYKRRGHIPRSLSLPTNSTLDSEGRLLDQARLAAKIGEYLGASQSPIVLYCGGGIAAASIALALTCLGRSDVMLYDGSLEEWADEPSLPLDLGAG